MRTSSLGSLRHALGFSEAGASSPLCARHGSFTRRQSLVLCAFTLWFLTLPQEPASIFLSRPTTRPPRIRGRLALVPPDEISSAPNWGPASRSRVLVIEGEPNYANEVFS